MTDKTKEVLKSSTIEGKVLKLPEITLERKEYLDIKKTIEKLGGKWKGGKISGFVFIVDPSTLIKETIGGKIINRKKDFQFFETPKELTEKIVKLANIEKDNLILEPSAGQGAIIEEINKKYPTSTVNYFELMPENRLVLEEKNLSVNYLGEDFMTIEDSLNFDRIIANPPFTRNQDIKHLRKMYDRLNENGILVCITSCSWVYGSTKVQNEFKNWLNTLNHKIIEVESGAFKKAKTNVETRIVKIIK